MAYSDFWSSVFRSGAAASRDRTRARIMGVCLSERGCRLTRSGLLLHRLRDRDEQRALLRILRIDLDAADQDRPAARDRIVRVQLARVRRVLAEQLEMDLDHAVRAEVARDDLQAAAARQLHLRRRPPVEVEGLLLEQPQAAEA